MLSTDNFVVNPYIAGSPIKDAAMFFGREDVYAWLRQHLRGVYQDNIIVLYGERRSGKTSVLYQMQAGLRDDRYIPILLDLQGMGLDGIDGFLWEIARKIILGLRRVDNLPKFDRPRRQDLETDPRHFFEEAFLPPIIAALNDRRLLMMFDETDRLTEKIGRGDLPPDVYDYLRSLAQSSHQMNFLFTLGRRIEITDKGSSALFNLAVYRKISFLDQDFAEDLIAGPAVDYYTYTRPAITEILRLTGGQPYYTQLLCHNLFAHWSQNKSSTLDVDAVSAVLPDVMEQGTANFQFVWEDSNPAEKATLAALAHASLRNRAGVMRRTIGQTLRRAGLYPPNGEVIGALQNLFERDVLNNEEPYEFRTAIIQNWLNKNKRLDWVKEELGEVAGRWKVLEEQRRIEAPTAREKFLSWAAPILAGILAVALIVTYLLYTNAQQAQKASNAALSAAEIRRVTEAARFEATVAAASTEVARLTKADNPAVVEARATARAAEEMAKIALAQITATAIQAQIATTAAEAHLELPPTTAAATPSVTPSPTASPSPTPAPTRSPTSLPSPTATPRPVFAAPLAGTIAYPAFTGQTYDLYFADVAGGTSRLYRSQASQPAFNVDGSRITFQSWAGTSRGQITASSAGGGERLITNFLEDELPTWSPDSQTILFFSRRTGDRVPRLYFTQPDLDFQQNQARQFDIQGEYATWGANGKIVFQVRDGAGFSLRLASADLATVTTISTGLSTLAPALSPDGTQIVFMARDENDNWDIYRVNVNGLNLVRLTTNPARDGLPAWSPNGRAVAYVSDRDGQWAIYGINADGSANRKLLDMAGSPDGIVFFDQANSTGWLEERISWSPQ